MVYGKKKKTVLGRSPFSGFFAEVDSLSCLLYCLIMISALLLVYTKHQARIFHAQKMQYVLEAQNLQADWSQLLVDIGRWMNQNHLKTLAKAEGFVSSDVVEVLTVLPVP